MKKNRNPISVLFVVILSCFLTGCDSNEQEQHQLQNFISQTKIAAASGHLSAKNLNYELPKPVTYPPQGTQGVSAQGRKSINPLENYPLNALRFTGTLSEGSHNFAFITTPDNQLFQVKIGDTLGNDSGKILRIEHDYIDVKQLSAQGNGAAEKITRLQLRE